MRETLHSISGPTSIFHFVWACQIKPVLTTLGRFFYRLEMRNHNPFRYFKTSPEIIRLAVMMYVRFPLSLRNVEDLLHERSIDICHKTDRYWWNRFGQLFASEIRKKLNLGEAQYSYSRKSINAYFLKYVKNYLRFISFWVR